jgi:hypothetical protein
VKTLSALCGTKRLFSFLQVLSFIIASSSFLNTAHLLVEKQSGKEAGLFAGF